MCSHLEILEEGNSDPLGSYLTVIDSTVGHLLEFNKKCVLPSSHGREIDDCQTVSYAKSYWQDSIASLQDECRGYGYLAQFAAILVSVSFDRNIEAAIMHARILRQFLQSDDPAIAAKD